MADWRTALLNAIHARATPQNIRFLTNWQRMEGGATNNDASFNWLNTTHGPGRSINSVGVKAFPNFQTGISSLAQTLENGRYGDIVSGLRTGNPYAGNVASGLETWVSGSPTGNPAYARHVLGGNAAIGQVPQVNMHPAVQRAAHAVATAPPEVVQLAYKILSQGGIKLPPLESFLPPATAAGNGSASRSPQAVVLPAAGSARLMAPVQGKIIGRPYQGTHRLYGNWESDNAVDIAVPIGTPIRAVANGTIGSQFGQLADHSGNLAGLRLHLVTRGNEFYYQHLSSFAPGVHPGAHVVKGQIIGYSGEANGVAHLHFAVEHGHPLGIK